MKLKQKLESLEQYKKFGKYLQENLDGIKKLIRTDRDWLMLNVGYEGMGKSNLGMQICKYVDPDFDVDRIVFTPAEFRISLEKVKRYQAILVDEGVEALFSRKAMSRESVDITQILTQIRHKNLFIVINTPDPFLIDKYILSHRAKFMTRIINRGLYAVYSKKKMMLIDKNPITKATKYPQANFMESFDKIEGTKLWEDYLQKKTAFINANRSHKVWKLRLKQEAKMKKSYTLQDLAVINNTSMSTVKRWVYDHKIFAKRHAFIDIFGRVRITEQGYRTGMKRLQSLRERLANEKLKASRRYHKKTKRTRGRRRRRYKTM
ncbi:MAG: hypothetical protein HYT70_03685 [Candidatus Aenigmarchaeota archaeon]|nr:hypothetical protein [Candidatus Aenigmarchaeota archaeon]